VQDRFLWPKPYTYIHTYTHIPTYIHRYIHTFFYLVCEVIGTAATPGLLCQPRVIVKMIWRSRWNVDWQGKPKFSLEKTCRSATFVHHKIPHDQTRVWTRAVAVGSRRLTAWAMARPTYIHTYCFPCMLHSVWISPVFIYLYETA
jgi:hypothetical protein